MKDGCLKGRFLAFLAIVGCLGISLQNAEQPSSTEGVRGAFHCVETSLAAAPTSPTESAGEVPSCEDNSSPDCVFVAGGLPLTELPEERHLLAASRTALAEGFPAEIDHPPMASS